MCLRYEYEALFQRLRRSLIPIYHIKSRVNTQGVRSHDIVSITTLEKNIRKRDNKSFCIFFETGDIPYDVGNKQMENRWTTCFEVDNHNAGIDTRFDVI